MAATRVPNYYLIKKLSLQKKSKKGFKITEGFLSYGSMLEFEARRSPYLESSSIITCGGPRSILAAAALRLR